MARNLAPVLRIRGFGVLAAAVVLSLAEVSTAPALAERAPAAISAPADLAVLDAPIRVQYGRLRQALDRLLEQPDAPATVRAQAFGRLGQWFQVYDYLERAQLCYQSAHDLAPLDYRWSYFRGHVLRELGRLDAARTSFRRTLELRPGDVSTLVWLGNLEFEAGRLEEAGTLLGEALDHDPGAVRAWAELGRVELARGRPQHAADHLERALELQPGVPSVHYSLGLAYRQLDDRERAGFHLERARVQQSSKTPPILADPLLSELEELEQGSKRRAGRAQFLFDQGRYEEAAEEFRRAQLANPENPTLGTNRGLALLNAGRVTAAREVLSQVVQRFPDYPGGHFNLAVAMSQTGDLAGAVQHLRIAIRLDPGSTEAYDALASILVLQNQPEEALTLYHKIQALDPVDERARYRHAVLLIHLGHYGRARTALEEARQVLPRSRRLGLVLARLLAAAPEDAVRDGALSLSLAQEAARQSADQFTAESLAMAYAEMQHFEEAVAWQRRAQEQVGASGGETLRHLRERLALYTGHKPCRRPLYPGEGER